MGGWRFRTTKHILLSRARQRIIDRQVKISDKEQKDYYL